jgi:hypothetical protein
LRHELEAKGSIRCCRSTIYRVWVRHHLVEARPRRRRREDYIRFERDARYNLAARHRGPMTLLTACSAASSPGSMTPPLLRHRQSRHAPEGMTNKIKVIKRTGSGSEASPTSAGVFSLLAGDGMLERA